MGKRKAKGGKKSNWMADAAKPFETAPTRKRKGVRLWLCQRRDCPCEDGLFPARWPSCWCSDKCKVRDWREGIKAREEGPVQVDWPEVPEPKHVPKVMVVPPRDPTVKIQKVRHQDWR
jgi:hypothetical protein